MTSLLGLPVSPGTLSPPDVFSPPEAPSPFEEPSPPEAPSPFEEPSPPEAPSPFEEPSPPVVPSPFEAPSPPEDSPFAGASACGSSSTFLSSTVSSAETGFSGSADVTEHSPISHRSSSATIKHNTRFTRIPPFVLSIMKQMHSVNIRHGNLTGGHTKTG